MDGQDELPIEGLQRSISEVATQRKLAEVLTQYDVVEVVENGGDPFLIVSEKRTDLPTGPSGANVTFSEPREMVPYVTSAVESYGPAAANMRQLAAVDSSQINTSEIGTSSPSPFTSWMRREYNSDLMGLKGLQNYDKMRKSDGVVRGTLRAVKTPVLAARWFVEPASQSTQDKNKADFVWRCFTEFMSISWPQVLTEALLMADFGYYMFEKVWVDKIVDGQKRWTYQKLAPRHPMDVKKWYYDAEGGPAGVCMWAPAANVSSAFGGSIMPTHVQTVNGQPAAMNPDRMTPFYNADGSVRYYEDDEVEIPIDKLLVFTFDREAGNIEGISVLRSAFKHWYYKEQLYKIDAIQKERHGIGIPVIKLPPSYNAADKRAAEELGRNLRTNERAHVVLPPFWELMFAKLEGHVVNALESVKVHDAAIRENVLVGFNGSDHVTKEEDQTMMLKATRFIADIVCDTFNLYSIPQLIDYSYAHTERYPKLRARRIGEQQDWRTLSFALRNLIGAGVITPDAPLEEWIRNEMDLPHADPSTARTVAKPQAPQIGDKNSGAQGPDTSGRQDSNQNKVGLPRQTSPSAQPPRGNGGRDASGGK